jgi:hypothetical protein
MWPARWLIDVRAGAPMGRDDFQASFHPSTGHRIVRLSGQALTWYIGDHLPRKIGPISRGTPRQEIPTSHTIFHTELCVE